MNEKVRSIELYRKKKKKIELEDVFQMKVKYSQPKNS